MPVPVASRRIVGIRIELRILVVPEHAAWLGVDGVTGQNAASPRVLKPHFAATHLRVLSAGTVVWSEAGAATVMAVGLLIVHDAVLGFASLDKQTGHIAIVGVPRNYELPLRTSLRWDGEGRADSFYGVVLKKNGLLRVEARDR